MASAEQSDFFENLNDLIKRALLVVDETSVTSLFGGWRPDLLIDTLSVREKKLLICSTCHGVMRDAVFYGKDYTCKVCFNSDVLDSAFVNENTRCIINDLQIKCPLTEEGCDWTGAIETLTTHFLSCLYYPVPCPLACTVIDNNTAEPVITTLPRHEVESHVKETCPNKEINCDYCNNLFKSAEMNFHVSDCKSFPLACPNNCINPHNNKPTLVKRGEMNNHTEIECTNVEIDCPYLSHGCNVKLLRKNLATHEQDSMPQHLRLMNTKLAEKDNMISSLENKCEVKLSYINNQIQEFWKASNELKNESFSLAEAKCASVDEKFNRKLLEKDEIIYSLESQLAEEIERIDTQFEEFRNLIENQDKLIKQTENQCQSMCTNLKNIISEKDTKLNLVVQQLKCSNLANPFEWTIEEVRDCIRNKDVLTSDMFYACQCKFYCTAGFRQHSNNSLSFFICIANGEFDDYLSWPLLASCKYILLNLDNPNDHYVMETQNKFNKPLFQNPYKYGFTEFVNFSKLTHEGKYRQNDKITLRVEIRSSQ